MKAIDWTKIYKKYKGQWVAMADDEITVIASGYNPQEVLKKSAERGYIHPILNRIPTEIIDFVGAPHEVSI